MSHCAVCCNKQFVANGCQVPVPSESGGAVACGETQTLDLISQIRQEFENKMQQIDTEAGGDCMSGLQAKLHLQEEWIRSLTIQNEMLVKAVKELETEAIRRVSKSEEKLESSCHVGSESMVNNCTALTADLAEKNEIILGLRRDNQRLEDHCRQTNQHCQFKDELIKALRKQLKVLQSEVSPRIKLQAVSSQTHESIILHNCCPYAKEFCPVYMKANTLQLPPAINLENLKTALKIQSSLVTGKNSNVYIDDQTPTHDNLAPSTSSSIQVNTHEKARSLSNEDLKQRKQKTKLTARNIMLNCYDFPKDEMLDNLGTFSKIPKKINVTIPNHVSVKTFVNNLESNTGSKTQENRKKIKAYASN